jgi:hypothetical protein
MWRFRPTKEVAVDTVSADKKKITVFGVGADGRRSRLFVEAA